jgi:hypothetical protein
VVAQGAAESFIAPLAEPIKGRYGNMIYELRVGKGTSFCIRELDDHCQPVRPYRGDYADRIAIIRSNTSEQI